MENEDRGFDFIDYSGVIREVIQDTPIFNNIRFRIKDRNSNIQILEENPPNIISIRNDEARKFKLSNMSFTTILGKEEEYIKNDKFRNKVNSCNASVLTKRNQGNILQKAKRSFDVIIIWKSGSFLSIETRFGLLNSPGALIFPIILREEMEGDNKMKLGQLKKDEIDLLFKEFESSLGENCGMSTVDINDKYYSLVMFSGGK